MRRLTKYSIIGMALAIALTSMAYAGKPAGVVEWSNGFPSGLHFNLNIHGKAEGYICSTEPGGGSVFVPEYGDSEIQISQNKRSGISELVVHDQCAEAFDGDPVQVQLPTGEYQVYARILAKPTKENEPREVSFSPKLVEACNDATIYDYNGDGVFDLKDVQSDLNGDGVIDQLDFEILKNAFGDLVECIDTTLIGLGIVTGTDAFAQDGQLLARASGKSKAVNVSDMFMYSGIVYDSSLDYNSDGNFDLQDFIAHVNTDLNGDSSIGAADFEAWLLTLIEAGLVLDFRSNPIWVFDLAELVVYGWDYRNNGSKLVQVRFYPKSQTTFVSQD